jgi:hypothetical protein
MRRIGAIVRGVLGGAAATACMSVLRMAARRAGLIHATPPQATREWLAERSGVEPEATEARHFTDAAVHTAVGVAGGAVYGALGGNRERPSLAGGALFGLGVWLLAFGVVAPRLGITRSPRESSWAENAVNVAAHALYGTATALVAGELTEQARAGATVRRRHARIG